jgi:hypothetical protein
MTYPLTNSANFVTSKPVISKEMALAKSVLLPKREQSRRMVQIQIGEKLSHVICGMTANVAIRLPHVSSGISVRYAMGHIAKVPALAKRAQSFDLLTFYLCEPHQTMNHACITISLPFFEAYLLGLVDIFFFHFS